jgi:hypothetical protein
VDEPRRRLDPLAVAVNAVAVVAMLAVGGYLAVSIWRDAPAPKPKAKPVVVAKPAQQAPPSPVARIEIRLSYVEDGVERASATETVWYAWRFLQVVKIVREGKTPDEAAHRVEANLIAHLYP